MVKLALDEIKIGMILGEDIYNHFDVMIVGSGTIITNNVYDTLERLGVDSVTIVEKEVKDSKEIVVIDDPVQDIYNATVDGFKNIFKGVKFGRQLVAEEVKEVLAPMLDQIKNNPSITKIMAN